MSDTQGINLHAQKDCQLQVSGAQAVTVGQLRQQQVVGGDEVVEIDLQNALQSKQAQTYQVGSSTLKLSELGVSVEALHVFFASAGGSPMPIARLGDFHHCPKTNSNNQPHVGGKIAKGSSNVLLDGKPVARISDMAVCQNGPPDSIAQGNHTLLVNAEPAAHLGFKTAHGGKIQQGSPTASGGIHASASTAQTQAPKPSKMHWGCIKMRHDKEIKV